MPTKTTKVVSQILIEFEMDITEDTSPIIQLNKPKEITGKVVKINVGGVRFPNFLWILQVDQDDATMANVMEGIKQYLAVGRARDPILHPQEQKVAPPPDMKDTTIRKLKL